MNERLYAVARGHVQGVSYRWFVVRVAQSLGIVGWTRNGANGRSVEVIAEGSRPHLDQLIHELHDGPPRARVDSVEVSWETIVDDMEEFSIRY
jgi:acylphosphatase